MPSYQRTQIYLDPEQHRKLVDEAAARGTSLAALLREVVGEHLEERAGAGDRKTFEAITAIVDLDHPTDLVGEWDRTMAEAMEARYRKKTGAQRRRRR
jgi:hypothetical protein